MGHQPSLVGSAHSRSGSDADSDSTIVPVDLDLPFPVIQTLGRSHLRETAYELFFMSCRSSPGFSSRLTHHPDASPSAANADASPGLKGGGAAGTGMMAINSRIKRSLGLKARRSSQPTRPISIHSSKQPRRPMTSAEIMRHQMRISDQSDARLRKTLMRTLAGQLGRRADTIILPLELLRQLKPSEFADLHEYHRWQRRQLKVLEAGLLLHPSTPLERLNAAALRFREVMRASETKPIDTSKNSEPMRSLCSSVVSLAWRSTARASPSETCHWADGFPLNVHLYVALLQSVFDHRDETVVLDEVDELVELMRKTWSTLGINRMIHNVCFVWVLFQQYVATGQVEPDLISATLTMLADVAGDAKRSDREPSYIKVLSAVMVSMQGWAERRLLDYHEAFDKAAVGIMECTLNLALATTKIIHEDLPGVAATNRDGNPVDYYIRSAMRSSFTKILENGRQVDSMILEADEDPSELLLQLAKDTERLAATEREKISPLLRRWHPVPAAVAIVTLHNCFGMVLKQYLARVTSLTNELVRVLHSARKLEKVLASMVVEDSADCDDGGKAIVGEMIPYEVDSIIVGLLRSWIEERLRMGRECLARAKETESWIPRSKAEPYAQSAVDLMKVAKVSVDEFFDIPVAARDDMVQDLADGLEKLFQDYTSFVASCGSKHSYLPRLPPLTRCNQDSRFAKLWKRAAPCRMGAESPEPKEEVVAVDRDNPRPSTSRGTQRLYIRLNTLHYLDSHIHSIDKSLSLFSRGGNNGPSPSIRAANSNRRLAPSYHLIAARAAIQAAIQQVSEVAAHRLVFLDSRHLFYDGLYLGEVANARIRPAVRSLKQNLTFMVTMLTDRAQPVAVREVMRAAFEAFLLVLLAGGSERAFVRADQEMVAEDFRSLKRAFCTRGEGLVAEEVVDREAEVTEGIVGLMGMPTERLVEEFSIAACEMVGAGAGAAAEGQRVPLPATTARWNRADPNTLLRVLCHRNDDVADQFLKRTYNLPKRRG